MHRLHQSRDTTSQSCGKVQDNIHTRRRRFFRGRAPWRQLPVWLKFWTQCVAPVTAQRRTKDGLAICAIVITHLTKESNKCLQLSLQPTTILTSVQTNKFVLSQQSFSVVDEGASMCFVRFQVCDYTCFLKAHWSQDLVFVVLSFVGGSLVELVSGHPRPSSVEALLYRGCPCRDPPVCHRVQDDSVAKRQPFFVLVGVVTSCVLCARIRGRVSR